jgi:flagellar hook protein FlgE
MPFNTALSGIRAANDDLRLTGNNIANASTNGFKESRAEFGDVYSTSVLGGGLNQIGSGVRVQDVAQQFSQGNISFTENVLDLAISGSGFFVTSLNGDQGFTRAGTFGIDEEGYVTNNINARLQGFNADADENLSDLPTDIIIETSNLPPQATTDVDLEFNLDSREIEAQTAFTIDAAGVAAIEAAGVDNVGITNPTGVQTLIPVGTVGADTATTIAAALNGITGVEALPDGSGGVEIVFAEGYSLTQNSAGGDLTLGLTTALTTGIGFDAADPTTYNHSTASTIYDSQGNPHTMQQFFIKQPYDSTDPTTANLWQLAIQIDGRNVGASTDITTDQTSADTAILAAYNIAFTTSGAFNPTQSDDIDVTNWFPVDTNGEVVAVNNPNSAPTNSDFTIDMLNSTQVANEFEVRAIDQDGTTSGRLAGINIDDSGIIFARYTNGQNRVLAQVALADFANTQGLQSLGNTSWAETSDSGEPVIGGPGTASLGLVQSGALEDSNVDLSEQLVNLIIAQRNFQANAKTIETADQTTQTIINLR